MSAPDCAGATLTIAEAAATPNWTVCECSYDDNNRGEGAKHGDNTAEEQVAFCFKQMEAENTQCEANAAMSDYRTVSACKSEPPTAMRLA